ncbi:MAG: cysteine desulfurase [Balneolaceae bacterium]|nr:cysteine desulfurase [Balneolaceae bacterium]
MIYLDYAATTPIYPQVMEVMQQVSTRYFGNASSLHDVGSNAKQVLSASTKVIASSISQTPGDVVFTSGATEANFLAIQALLDGRNDDRNEIISSQMEHSSVINVLRRLESQGFVVRWVDVLENGELDLDYFDSLISDQTALITIQRVNSELGVIQPLEKIGKIIEGKDIRFHSDCVQSFGKLPLDPESWGVDAISISAHKIYGPKGVGALWMRKEVDWKPMFDDPDQKRALRYGTANVPGIAAFATAAKISMQGRDEEHHRITNIRQQLIDGLKALPFEVVVEGDSDSQSPYILGVRFPGIEGQFLMLECSQAGLAISTGSACQVGSDRPNRTMMALGRNDEQAREFVRLSFGRDVKEHDIPEIIEKIDSILTRHFKKVHRS